MSIRSIGATSRTFLGKLRSVQLTRLLKFARPLIRPRLRPVDVVDVRHANLAAHMKHASQVKTTYPHVCECAESNVFPYDLPDDAIALAGLVDLPDDAARSDNHLRVIEALEHPRNQPLAADQVGGQLDELA